MRAGSMLAEVSRTTCLISLAIIRSFSKFTSPSTVESLPEMVRTNKHDLPWNQVEFWQFLPETSSILGYLQDHNSSSELKVQIEELLILSLLTWYYFTEQSDFYLVRFRESETIFSIRRALFSFLNLNEPLQEKLWEEVCLVCRPEPS